MLQPGLDNKHYIIYDGSSDGSWRGCLLRIHFGHGLDLQIPGGYDRLH